MQWFLHAVQLALILPISVAAPTQTTSSAGVHTTVLTTVSSFTNGTWLENLAQRPNGQILVTTIVRPIVYLVDPAKPEIAPVIIHTFPNIVGTLGITPGMDDATGTETYYVAGGNLSLSQDTFTNNSWTIYKIDMAPFRLDKSRAVVSTIAQIPTTHLINGITTLDKHHILAAASLSGIVYRINVLTGVVVPILNDPLLGVPTGAADPLGVNGLKIRRHPRTLYWTNTSRGIIAYVDLNDDGSAKGAAQTLAEFPGGDDFALVEDGILGAGNDELRFVNFDNGAIRVVSNSSLLAGSTSVLAGRKGDAVFVTTSGGTEQYPSSNYTNPGKLVRVEVITGRIEGTN